MIRKEQEIKTDQAWQKLYERLGTDGLLPDSPQQPRRRSGTFRRITAIAACAALVAVLITLKYTGKDDPVSLHNGPGAPTMVVTLEDGSIVWLEENSTLFHPGTFAAAERKVRLEGNAFFEVTGNRSRPFIIETEQATVEVVGTAFHVRAEKTGDFSLSVNQGEVKVSGNPAPGTPEAGETLHILAGETALFSENRLVKTETGTFRDPSRRGYVHFKDQRLGDIVRYINENTESLTVILPDNLEERLVTVAFAGESTERMTELLCEGLGLSWTRDGDRITILGSNR